MGSLVWLASYPKSGNTWFRGFLSSLHHGGTAIDLNALDTDGIASSRSTFEEMVGVPASELAADLVAGLRDATWRAKVASQDDRLFVKVHDARVAREFPSVYLVRNPLDVCVSFSHHNGRGDLDRTIGHMADPTFGLASRPGRYHGQLPQPLGTWSQHVSGWLATSPPPKVIRYEDMLSDPRRTFSDACAFLGLPQDAPVIEEALRHTAFTALQQQERDSGFLEKPSNCESFFRRGRTGSWREELTTEQVGRLLADHGAVMAKLGYLTADGKPVY